MTEHARHYPICPFVRGRECGNVPAECDSESDESIEDRALSLDDIGGYDEVGYRIDDVRHNSFAERDPRLRLTSTQLNVHTPEGTVQTNDLSQLGISEHHAPIHPNYATVESRLRTYQFWPPALAQKPQQLSEAGFFYAGVSDHVKCFHCDGGLRNWVPGDDPWTEHARWFSRCGFIRLVRGDDFIQSVLQAHPQVPLPAAEAAPAQETTVKRFPLSEEDLEMMMENAICKTAVELGVAREAVKRVLKQRFESTGKPFSDLSSILAMAFGRNQPPPHVPPPNNGSWEGAGHSRVSSTLSAASSGGDSGVEDTRIQDEDMEGVQERSTPPPADVQMSSQVSHESSTSTLTSGSGSSGSGNNTPKVLSPGAGALATSSSTSSLEEEYQRLKEQRQCKVCMDQEVGVVFLPCGHLITCVNCAPVLRDCPLCRQPIKGTLRTYLS